MSIVKTIFVFCFVLMMTGCNAVEKSNRLASTSADQTEEAISTPTAVPMPGTDTPPAVDSSAQLISSYSIGDSDKWFFYNQKIKDESEVIVWHSSDNGVTWEESMLPTEQLWEKEITKGTLFVSLHSEQEAIPSWVLLTSGPALGLMEKSIYTSSDHGKSWSFKGELGRIIRSSYITGISFRNEQTGWITGTYHGGPIVPLFRTDDGGDTWNLQEITLPQQYNYGDAYPPSFDVNNNLIGILSIECNDGEKRITIDYETIDGGKTWALKS
ncbi:hypothetical protein FHS15_004059 [Paenibacillus castaneae]|uniref:WD40/YVTN/BNR-like repeat-containing protein n=1 Tax=Paenibacillus castaneae TaxID=474957 RepID=UPI000C9B5441|nr:hypothetical protein [Paenibacillus castaneae]NIK78913.1 hypothetical protein [Paenibacillus castaneae]